MAGISEYKSYTSQRLRSEDDDVPHFPSYAHNQSPSFYEDRGTGDQQYFYNSRQPTTPGGRTTVTASSSSQYPVDHLDTENLQLKLSRDEQTFSKGRNSPDGADPGVWVFGDKSAAILSIFTENFLSHPFLVVRRQCQVHVDSSRYHVSPLSLIGPVFRICQRQGCGVLWKGLGSSLLVRGMTMFVEDLTSKVSTLPSEVTRHSSLKSVSQHMLLKAISLAVITPFYSINILETVQSEVVAVSESSGLLDVFTEGFRRIICWPNTGRLVPLYVLVVPTVVHGLLSYLIYTGIKSVSLATIRRLKESKERKQGALSKNSGMPFYAEMTASLIGHATADVLLYPLETILHRLHLQGTRTIIDSLDCGIEVTPVITGYEGVLHCFRTTIQEEGFSGLFKGFGALILQYGIQILLIRAVKIAIEKNPFGSNNPLSENTILHPVHATATPLLSTAESENIGSVRRYETAEKGRQPRSQSHEPAEPFEPYRRRLVNNFNNVN